MASLSCLNAKRPQQLLFYVRLSTFRSTCFFTLLLPLVSFSINPIIIECGRISVNDLFLYTLSYILDPSHLQNVPAYLCVFLKGLRIAKWKFMIYKYKFSILLCTVPLRTFYNLHTRRNQFYKYLELKEHIIQILFDPFLAFSIIPYTYKCYLYVWGL